MAPYSLEEYMCGVLLTPFLKSQCLDVDITKSVSHGQCNAISLWALGKYCGLMQSN